MTNLIENIDQNTVGLPTQTAANMKKAIAPMAERLVKMESDFNAIGKAFKVWEHKTGLCISDDPHGLKNAALKRECQHDYLELVTRTKKLRISYQNVRIAAEKVKTQEKKTYLMAGNAIQGMFNIIKNETIPKEEKLKDIENYEKLQAAKARQKLAEERKSALNALAMQMDRQISEMPTDDELGTMNETVWKAYFSGTKADLLDLLKLEEIDRQRQDAERKKGAEVEAKRIVEAIKKAEGARLVEEKHQAALAPDKEKIAIWGHELYDLTNDAPSIDHANGSLRSEVRQMQNRVLEAVGNLLDIVESNS